MTLFGGLGVVSVMAVPSQLTSKSATYEAAKILFSVRVGSEPETADRSMTEDAFGSPAVSRTRSIAPVSKCSRRRLMPFSNGRRRGVRLRYGRSDESLQAWCREWLRREAVPEDWFFVTDIPRTPRGNISRDFVRRMLLNAASGISTFLRGALQYHIRLLR
jgi:hypothetical protein